MDYQRDPERARGFTLVEVLIVLAVIAVLAIVVVLTLNPAQLFTQSRDANRVAGIATLDKSVSLYYSTAMSNPAAMFMGTSSIVYVSIPDPTATSTAGTNCAGLGIASGTVTFHCAAPSTYRNVNGTGWIPINFTTIPGGSSLSALPVDPINTISSNEFFVYETDGVGGYELMSNPETTKFASDTTAFVRGSNLALLTSFPNTLIFTTSTYAEVQYSMNSLAFDSHTNTIWGNDPGPGSVTQINDTTYASSTYAELALSPYKLAFDSHTNTIWWINDNYGSLTQMNDTTYATSTYATISNPFGIAFDSHTNTIWDVTDSNGSNVGSLGWMNDTTYASSSYSPNSLCVGQQGKINFGQTVVFDSHTNTIWVQCGDGTPGQVIVMNDTTYATSSVAAPGVTAFDPHTDTIWALGSSNTVTAFNDTTYTSSTIVLPSGSAPGYMTFDSHTNSMWVSNSGYNNVTQINDTTYATSTYVTSASGPITFDSHTNTIWVGSANGAVLVFTPNR